MAEQRARPRRAKGSKPARSVRLSDPVWDKARARASYEDVTISYVIDVLLDGYGRGLINLPQVKVQYSQPKAE